jgi:hypothetical protein
MIRLPSAADVARAKKDVTVRSTITEIDPDDRDGSYHQIFSVRVDDIIQRAPQIRIVVGQTVNVAVRYGDRQGLPAAIPGLALGETITLCGAYINREVAYPEPDGDWNAVIHFTHRPLGWVEYMGHHYE